MSGPWADPRDPLARQRFLLVGEAPSGGKRNLDVALACRSVGWRPVAGTMARMAEVYPDLFAFCMSTRHVNLLSVDQPRLGKGRAFPVAKARDTAELWRQNVLPGKKYEVVLLAGHRVASAFHAAGRAYFEWFEDLGVPGTRFAVVPHPSGVSRWHNEGDNRAALRAFLESLGATCRDLW